MAQKRVALRLATLLRAGRSVVSGYQGLINDPNIGDKKLDGERIVREALVLYEQRTGRALDLDGLPDGERRLVAAQLAAMREVIDEARAQIDMPGIGFKGFIPAVFARLVNERFAEKVGQEAKIKVTAPVALVRNRKSRPDPWEREVIAARLSDPMWPKGQAFVEETDHGGQRAFRVLFPEYYDQSCLSCHGGPAGELDVTGYPKEGGSQGDLGGAISIILYR